MLVAVTLGFLAGVLAAHQADVAGHHVVYPLLGLTIALLFFRLRVASTRTRAITLGAAGFLCGLGVVPEARAPPLLVSGLARITATVTDSRRSPDSSTVQVISGELITDSAPLPAEVRLFVPDHAMPAGSTVEFLARVRPSTVYRNESPSPTWDHHSPTDGLARLAPGAAPQVVKRDDLRDFIESVRTRLRDALRSTLPPDAAQFARAVVLGEAYALAEDQRDAVRGAGLAHILAVSGLHVTLVAGLAVLTARRLFLCVRWIAVRIEAIRLASLIGVIMAVLYATLSGGAPSAIRAALTASIALSLRAAGRRPELKQVATAAILLFASVDPNVIVRPAFLLSVAATAAIVSVELPKERDPWSVLKALLTSNTRATIATAPMVAWWFGAFPVLGLLANVVLLPLASSILVPLAGIHCIVAVGSSRLASVTGPVLTGAYRAFQNSCGFFDEIGWGNDLPPLTTVQVIVLGCGCCGLLLARQWPLRLVIVALLAVGITLGELQVRHSEAPTDELRVTMVDVGQGDAIAIDLPDGRLMLIDGGGDPLSGRRALLPLLRARRRDHVDIAVLTHPHPDHYEGLITVVDALGIGELWTTKQALVEAPEARVARWIAELERAGTTVRYPAQLCDSPQEAQGATLEVLWPCPRYEPGFELNDNSIVVRLRFGSRRWLFTGDLETSAEEALLAQGIDLQADVLKVGHHGSRTSTTPAFLRAVRPRLALVSAGRGNRYGHPHADVLSRLQSVAEFVGQTDRMGSITIRSDGHSLRVRTFSGGALRF